MRSPTDESRAKKPKKEAVEWYEPGIAEPNASEMLFYVLLLLVNAESVVSLNEWATNVVKERSEAEAAGARWKPNSWAWSTNNKVSTLFWPMEKAFKSIRDVPSLEILAAVMRSWDGPGGCDEDVYGKHLSNYMHRNLVAPSGNPRKPKDGPPRWRTYMIVHVAGLVLKYGVALRKALHLDGMEPEEVPTIRQRAVAAEARVTELESEQGELVLLLAKAADAKRKAAERKAEQKESEKSRRKARVRAEAAKRKQQVAATVDKKLPAIKRRLEEAAEADKAKRAKEVSAARARARAVESSAKLSAKRLRRLKKAEAELSELRQELDAVAEESEESEEEQEHKSARRGNNGRFQAEPWQQRVLKYAQIGRGVAPSTISANITEVLTIYAAEAVVPQPCVRQMKKLRTEVAIAGEMIAALRVALAIRIISFGFDESTKWGLGLLSTNTQIEPHDAPGTSVDVVMRGATLTAGGTAEHISKEIEVKLFQHARRLLTLWKEEHEGKYGEGSWEKAEMPSPDNIGLHRLSENAVIMSDTCNAARATKRLLAEMAEKAGRERIGDEAWEEMSEEEREEKVRCHLGDCHDHMRNIIIKAMAAAATSFLEGKLADSLDTFSSFDRVSVDGMEVIRAACKELHPNGQYAKGKGREMMETRKQSHKSELWLPIFNAAGTRMDAVFDGAVPLYVNRMIILDLLHPLVNGPASKDNILEKSLWRELSCTEMISLMRVCTLWQTIVTEPLRWLSGKASKCLDDWSMVNSNALLDTTYDLMVKVAADGRALLDPTLDPFSGVKQKAFAEHRREQQQQKQKAPDGTVHFSYVDTLREARSPSTVGGEESTPITIELAQVMANAALVAMRDERRSIADKLSSQGGANAANAAKAARVHEKTKGAHVMNAHVETNFGIADNRSRTYRGMAAENLSALVQQGRMGDFEMAPNVAHDRRKRKVGEPAPEKSRGFFWSGTLTDELRSSLVAAVRKEAEPARAAGRKALAEHDAAKMARREERLVTALNAAVDYFAYGKELYEAWSGPQRATTATAVDAALKGVPEVKQLEYLRLQIDMRTIGLGWDQFKTKWSSKTDATVGTVAHLRALLVDDILPYERAEARLKRLPTEAAPPQFTAKEIGQLGTESAEACAVKSKAIFSMEELERKTAEAMARREAAGISDSVEWLQQKEAPAFNQQLVGKRLEVLWKYQLPDGTSQLIWATGRVARVADGLTDKRSQRAKNLLPGGAVLWAWDADPEFGEVAGEKWLVLLPSKWNPTKAIVYGWRYDPRELSSAAAAPVRDERRRGAVCMDA